MAAGDILSRPAAAAGLSATSNAASWNRTGAWVEVFSASEFASVDVAIIGVQYQQTEVAAGADATKEVLLDIGTGGAGSETVVIELPYSIRFDTAVAYMQSPMEDFILPEPYLVPAGTRVAVRLTDAQSAALTQNGIKLILQEQGAGITHYELDCQPGTYATTGTVASPVAGRQVNAEPTSYAVTGAAATFHVGRALNAATGTYALAGSAAGLLSTRLVNAESGAYTLTGADAFFVKGFVLSADPGGYAVTGTDAGFVVVRMLNAGPGAYVITGSDAELVYTPVAGAFVLAADPGTYTLTGLDARTAATFLFIASPGSYTLTGFATTLQLERTIHAVAGAYLITGTSTGHVVTRALLATPGDYLLDGIAAGLISLAAIIPGDAHVTADGPLAETGVVNAVIAAATSGDQEIITFVAESGIGDAEVADSPP